VSDSRFRNPDGTLTAEAVTGKTLLVVSGCTSCHGGIEFTESGAATLRDVGTLGPASGSRAGGPLTGIDTPTLKGVWETAPYLHDGSAATLRDVLTTRNPAGRHGGATATLPAAQLDALLAYLLQLDEREVPPVTIANLSVRDASNAADGSVQTDLRVGAKAFGDRAFVFAWL